MFVFFSVEGILKQYPEIGDRPKKVLSNPQKVLSNPKMFDRTPLGPQKDAKNPCERDFRTTDRVLSNFSH